jgi:hypothetical protein
MDWITGELFAWYGDSMVLQVEESREPVTADWCRDFVYEDFDSCELKEGTALHSIFNHLLWYAEWDKLAERVNAVLED